jgi:hypothetical protein
MDKRAIIQVPLKFLEKFQTQVPKKKKKKKKGNQFINIFLETHSSRYSTQPILSRVDFYLGETQSAYSSKIFPKRHVSFREFSYNLAQIIDVFLICDSNDFI